MGHFEAVPQRRPKTWDPYSTRNTISQKVKPEELEANRARIAEIQEMVRSDKVKVLEIPRSVSTWAALKKYLAR